MSDYYLRELELEDSGIINSWRNDPEIINHLGAPFRYISQSVDEDWLESYLNNRESCVRLAICKCQDKGVIGAVYLLNIDWIARSCEFAIWIGDHQEQGRGAGKFATLKALEHAFFDLNLNSVSLGVLRNNERAIKLYNRIGFVKEGVRREVVFKNGSYKDLVLMSMLKKEFKVGL